MVKKRTIILFPYTPNAPSQPIISPLSLTHIAQVCGSWTIKNLVNAKLRAGLAQVLEETPPTAE
jgi:hypothetical protein